MSTNPKGHLVLRVPLFGGTSSLSNTVARHQIVEHLEAAATIAAAPEQGVSLRTIPALNFSAEVAPGHLLSVYAEQAQEGRVPVQAWVQSGLGGTAEFLCGGTFEFGTASPVAATAAAQPVQEDTPPSEPVPDPAPEPEEEADANLQDFSPDMAPALRDHLSVCFGETYADILNDDELSGLIETLKSPNVGGMLMDDSKAQFVITLGDRIIGCAMCASQHNITYIWGMYVQKAYQRVGLGQSLIEAMLQKLPEKGMVELTVLKASEPALAFFTSLGFKGHRSGEIEFVPGKSMEAANMYANVKTLRSR